MPYGDDDSDLGAICDRPAREGKYFVVLRSNLASVEYTDEPIEMYDDFWKYHPHGRRSQLIREFVAVKLSDEQINRQRLNIRLSSYRWHWQHTKGVGPEDEFKVPGNFVWFLELCKKHGWIGWLDFMANVVVNVPAASTVSYMGDLYAECIVVPQGLFEPAELLTSMDRGWIFQETAFGPLDELGVRHMLKSVSARGERVRAGDVDELLGSFAELAQGLGRLLARRGWEGFFKAEGVKLTQWGDLFPSDSRGWCTEVLADMLVQRLGGMVEERLTYKQLTKQSRYPRDWDLYQRVIAMVKTVVMGTALPAFHVLDYFTRPATANDADPLVFKLLTTNRMEACASVDAFLNEFGLPMLKAYAELGVTYEVDREMAVSAVALSLLSSHFHLKISTEELLRMAWVRCSKFHHEFVIYGVQPTIGKRLLGLGKIEGTPMVSKSGDIPTCYKTASGEVYDSHMLMGGNQGLSFLDGGMFFDAKGRQYHGFVCNPPSILATNMKFLVWRRKGDPTSLPAIMYVSKSAAGTKGPAAAEEVFFD